MTDDEALRAQLEHHEGWRAYPYVDTVGKVSIGIGRNLTDVGLHSDEIEVLYVSDVDDATAMAEQLCPSFSRLTRHRQHVLVDMAFNMGASVLGRFVKMFAAIAVGAWLAVADEMLDSKWARQVGDQPGQRAHTLARMMREDLAFAEARVVT